MKVHSGLGIATLLGLAAAAVSQDAADVYVLRSSALPSTVEPPSLPKDLARQILLRRTSRNQYGTLLQLESLNDADKLKSSIVHLTTYADPPAPLFAEQQQYKPSQLLLILEGVTDAAADTLKNALSKAKQTPAFRVFNPPSSVATSRLVAELNYEGVPSQPSSCTVDLAINPHEHKCWQTTSSVLKFDLKEDVTALHDLVKNLGHLLTLVSKNELEAAIVVIPESSRKSDQHTWASSSTASSDLRRRSVDEFVFTEGDPSAPATVAKPSDPVGTDGAFIWAGNGKGAAKIPACFNSLNSCVSATNNCSGHGSCLMKNNSTGGASEGAACFSCVCLATVLKEPNAKGAGKLTQHWGGAMCQKKDISVQFWLLTGFTITIISAVGFCISLLFSVGEEKLPGVIGAGVNRSK